MSSDQQQDEVQEFDFNDPETKRKIQMLKERLGTPDETLTPEAEAARSGADEILSNDKPITGADVNWDDFDLDPEIAHLYPRAILRTEYGAQQWVSYIDEFKTASKNLGGEGQVGKNKEPMNAGEYMGWMLNSKDGWKLGSVLPAGAGFLSIVLQRRVPVALPMPTLIQSDTVEVPALTDAELLETEMNSVKWAAEKDEVAAESFKEIAAEALGALEGGDYAADKLGSPSSEEK